MYFNKNFYQNLYTKNHFKKAGLIFFVSGLNTKYQRVLLNKEKLNNLKFNSKKIINKIMLNLIKTSIYQTLNFVIDCSLYLLACKPVILLKSILINLNSVFLINLALKINNKIYPIILINYLFTLNYFQNKNFIIKYSLLQIKKFNLIAKNQNGMT